MTLGGSAPGKLVAVVSGAGTTYDVAVRGMTGRGTVTLGIPAGMVHDASGNQNAASTSTDAEVLYDTWSNPLSPWDVNGQDGVTPLDALTLINRLNLGGDPALPFPTTGSHPYCDVNSDGFCTPSDVLLVINYLNGHAIGHAEAEAALSLQATTSNIAAGVNPPTAAFLLSLPETAQESIYGLPTRPVPVQGPYNLPISTPDILFAAGKEPLGPDSALHPARQNELRASLLESFSPADGLDDTLEQIAGDIESARHRATGTNTELRPRP